MLPETTPLRGKTIPVSHKPSSLILSSILGREITLPVTILLVLQFNIDVLLCWPRPLVLTHVELIIILTAEIVQHTFAEPVGIDKVHNDFEQIDPYFVWFTLHVDEMLLFVANHQLLNKVKRHTFSFNVFSLFVSLFTLLILTDGIKTMNKHKM